jgi:hypothetical protein
MANEVRCRILFSRKGAEQHLHQPSQLIQLQPAPITPHTTGVSSSTRLIKIIEILLNPKFKENLDQL